MSSSIRKQEGGKSGRLTLAVGVGPRRSGERLDLSLQLHALVAEDPIGGPAVGVLEEAELVALRDEEEPGVGPADVERADGDDGGVGRDLGPAVPDRRPRRPPCALAPRGVLGEARVRAVREGHVGRAGRAGAGAPPTDGGQRLEQRYMVSRF